MKNKGFTLVEILAVIVILGLLATMAGLSITRYRKQVDEKDLLNLHSAIKTSFANYRTVLAQSGEVIDSITISSGSTTPFDRYFEDLSYNGERLSKEDLEGTKIELKNKGTVLYNPEYINAVKKRIKNFDTLSAEAQEEELEKQYIIDATCMVTSTVTEINPSTNTDTKTAEINKSCKKGSDGKYIPSSDELICLSVWYKGQHVIDDRYEQGGAKSFNELCKYISEK